MSLFENLEQMRPIVVFMMFLTAHQQTDSHDWTNHNRRYEL
ncbi:hypothetical protein [Fluoribacter gormanii]|nr:hypothetical protein [Fluoribacter gormanii]